VAVRALLPVVPTDEGSTGPWRLHAPVVSTSTDIAKGKYLSIGPRSFLLALSGGDSLEIGLSIPPRPGAVRFLIRLKLRHAATCKNYRLDIWSQ